MTRTAIIHNTALGIAVLLLLAGMVHIARIGLGNLSYVRAQQEVSVWHRDGSQPSIDSILRAESAIQSALVRDHNNPDILTLAAQINGWKGFYLATQQNMPATAENHYRQSLDLLRQAIRLRPAHASTWALLAEYKTLLGERDGEWHLAKEKAMEFGGADIKLVNRMMAL